MPQAAKLITIMAVPFQKITSFYNTREAFIIGCGFFTRIFFFLLYYIFILYFIHFSFDIFLFDKSLILGKKKKYGWTCYTFLFISFDIFYVTVITEYNERYILNRNDISLKSGDVPNGLFIKPEKVNTILKQQCVLYVLNFIYG